MSNLLTCQQMKMMLDAYHDGELSKSEHEDVERHLGECLACQSDSKAIATIAASLKNLPRLTPKIDVASNIEELIAKRSKPVSPLRKPVVWSAVGIAAAVALVVLVGKLGVAVQPTNLATNPKAPISREANQPEMAVVPGANSTIAQGAKISGEKLAVKPIQHMVQQKPTEPEEKLIAQRPSVTSVVEKNNPKSNQDLTARPAEVDTAYNTGPAASVANNQTATANNQTIAGANNTSLVAVYDAEQHNAVTEELGITTDEDGLYAIKL